MPVVPGPETRGPKWLQRMFAERDEYDKQLIIIPGKGATIHETDSGTVVNLEIAIHFLYEFGPSTGGGFGDSADFNPSVIKLGEFTANGDCTFSIRKGLDDFFSFGGAEEVSVSNQTKKLKCVPPREMHGGETLGILVTCEPSIQWHVVLYGTGDPSSPPP